MKSRIALGLALVAALLASPAPAAAQAATYCAGTLVLNSIYSVVSPGPGGATIQYIGLFQNRDQQRRNLKVTLTIPARIGGFAVLQPASYFELGPYQQKSVPLLSLRTSHSGGAGAPTPNDAARAFTVSCRLD